ncbi:MAG: hypothetical protein AAGD22_13665 [Verrucomicrobiota bacterium]
MVARLDLPLAHRKPKQKKEHSLHPLSSLNAAIPLVIPVRNG